LNSRQLQYAILLSQIRNYSQVAEKLNISQPALSKQILSLEAELGIKLFDRNTTPLTLTPAGEFFVQEAKELLYKEDQLLRSMERYKSGEAGHLNIGITPFRSSYLIPQVITRVRERFPGIQVNLHEAGSDILRKEAAEGKYDFAVVNLPVDDSVLDIIHLEPDRLVLAVPIALCSKLPSPTHGNTITIKDCSDLPFVVVGQNQEMRRLFDKLCTAANFHPTIAAEVVSLTTAWAVARAGVGATILPMQFVNETHLDEHLRLYEIPDAVHSRQPVIAIRKGQHLSAAAEYAIRLLSDTNE